MKRTTIEEISPADGNRRNRLRVLVQDVFSDTAQVGVGFCVMAGENHWIAIHPAEIDELIRMLERAKRRAMERLDEKGL